MVVPSALSADGHCGGHTNAADGTGHIWLADRACGGTDSVTYGQVRDRVPAGKDRYLPDILGVGLAIFIVGDLFW
ncbi:hypothetical protein ES703_90952 [subsurface metagenome]